jgi:poly(hydroxyalkanoate) depolymerase family esterase
MPFDERHAPGLLHNMKTGYTARSWLNRLRSMSAPRPLPFRDDATAAMAAQEEAARLLQAGDLAGATTAIQRSLGRWNHAGTAASSEPAVDSGLRVLKRGTFSHYERPAPDSSAKGRPPAALGAQFQAATYTNGAGSRRYKLYIPSTYCGQSMPLIVMLHGCKQSPDDFAIGTGMNALAEEQQCFVAYPAQAKSANGSKCWNWFNALDQRRGYGEPAIIAGLTSELVTKYGLDAKRVYIAGLSAGAAMAVVMGTTYPDLYAAVGVHSGLPFAAAQDVPSAFAAMHSGAGSPSSGARGMPAIILHGDQDKTVHPCNGERVAAQCASGPAIAHDGNPAPLQLEEQSGRVPGGYAYTRRLYRAGNGDVLVEQWLVHGGGHAWFGGDPRGSYTDSKGPDASAEMMRFFAAHTL